MNDFEEDPTGKIVYQYGEALHLLDLPSGGTSKVDVRLGSDRVPVWPEYVGVDRHNGSFRVSSDGDRLLLEARGEILSIPVEEGEADNLTRSSGSREKAAVWSPDGELVGTHVSERGRSIPVDCDICHVIIAREQRDPRILGDLGLDRRR